LVEQNLNLKQMRFILESGLSVIMFLYKFYFAGVSTPKIAPSYDLAMSLLLPVSKMIFSLVQISLSSEHFQHHCFSRLWFKGHSQCQHFWKRPNRTTTESWQAPYTFYNCRSKLLL